VEIDSAVESVLLVVESHHGLRVQEQVAQMQVAVTVDARGLDPAIQHALGQTHEPVLTLCHTRRHIAQRFRPTM
jgi:hypothetical protein